MAAEIPQTLVLDHNQVSIQIDEEEEDGDYDAHGAGKVTEEKAMSVEDVGVNTETRRSRNVALKSKTSELTLSFEGKVYVFQEVTPEKVCLLSFLIDCFNNLWVSVNC